MADLTEHASHTPSRRIDRVWLTIAAIFAGLALADYAQVLPTALFAGKAFVGTLPFILFAVAAMGALKATGAETVIARAFEGRETRMILLAAVVGGISPFCSCEVIPFVAAMLAMGVPVSAVMAFWLSSPITDPPMFLITWGTLGFDFAMAKTLAAVGIGIFGGAVTMMLSSTAIFTAPLREGSAATGCGCGTDKPFEGKPVWRFWQEPARAQVFRKMALENLLFLTKWLALAYVIEALMLHYIPAAWIANALGGEGLQPILLGAFLGAPAYLNGYAAIPLVEALLAQGMSNGAAMSFMISGGITCVPAAIAVWALVKPRVFISYLVFAVLGAIAAGVLWQAFAG